MTDRRLFEPFTGTPCCRRVVIESHRVEEYSLHVSKINIKHLSCFLGRAWTTITTQKSSERRKKSSTMKDTPMKSRPVRPFSHSNKNPWRETVVEENDDDCSCSTDAVTVKVSNVVSFHRPPARPSVVLLPFMFSLFHCQTLSIVFLPLVSLY
jgi:hypothetical protein